MITHISTVDCVPCLAPVTSSRILNNSGNVLSPKQFRCQIRRRLLLSAQNFSSLKNSISIAGFFFFFFCGYKHVGEQAYSPTSAFTSGDQSLIQGSPASLALCLTFGKRVSR